MHRQRITRSDGRVVNIVQRRAHLSYCFSGCCCGRTDRGYAEAPAEVYREEWLRRKMRNTVHLTKAGCLGPCVLANVASLVFDGTSIWFHSVNSPWVVRQIFDYIDAMPEDFVAQVFVGVALQKTAGLGPGRRAFDKVDVVLAGAAPQGDHGGRA